MTKLGHPFRFVDDVFNKMALGSGHPPGKLPVFDTSDPCQSMGVWIEAGQQIKITFESTASFKDGSIVATEGYRSTDLGVVPLWRIPLKLFLVPLRRVLLQPWFRVIARIGVTGSTQEFLVPDPTEEHYRINHTFTARRSGELFLYVNDAVLGVPYIWGRYYMQNSGQTRVFIFAP